MKLAKLLAFLCFLAMSAVLVYAFAKGDFAEDGAKILANPWGIVSLVDLYAGFTLFSIWIAYREKSWFSSFLWIILMLVLGFWAGALYTLLALFRSKGNWHQFWLGNRFNQENG